jgi:hypothetical protein
VAHESSRTSPHHLEHVFVVSGRAGARRIVFGIFKPLCGALPRQSGLSFSVRR